MERSELLKKVRKIEIKAKGLSQNIFAGEYHSAFKGRGMTFSEVREYQYGDDVRDIDWNVTARQNHPYVKVYEEERELTVMLVVDVSGSKNFGAVGETKQEIMTEIAATIAFSAIENNDKVGVLLFSDKIEKFIPPQKGRKHILRVISELLNFQAENRGTDLNLAFEYLTSAIKKRCSAFIISDFLDSRDYYKSLSIANHKHDVIAVQVYDKREAQLPNVGLIKVADAESDNERWIDTSSRRVRQAYDRWWYERQLAMNDILTRSNVDLAQVATDEDYVKSLMALFKRRG